MSFSQVRLIGQWAGRTGSVTVTPTRTMVNSGVAVVDAPVVYTLDSAGSVAFDVAATDDTGTQPQGVQYQIVLQIGSDAPLVYFTPILAAWATGGKDLTLLPWTVVTDPTLPAAGSVEAWIRSVVIAAITDTGTFDVFVTAITSPDSTLTVGGTTSVPTLERPAITGDVSIPTGSNAAVLADTGPGATGPVGSTDTTPVVTIDAKGRVTALSSAVITPASIGAEVAGAATAAVATETTRAEAAEASVLGAAVALAVVFG
jgi:hypothetical protein